jgi:hypothetical protein
VKFQHNRQEATQIQGDDAPFNLLHPAPSSVNLRHYQAAVRILCNGIPFGLGDLAVIGEHEM